MMMTGRVDVEGVCWCLLSTSGRPYPIEISSKRDGEHSTQYYVTWNTPFTGGRPIIKYEFHLTEVSHSSRVEISGQTRRSHTIPDI